VEVIFGLARTAARRYTPAFLFSMPVALPGGRATPRRGARRGLGANAPRAREREDAVDVRKRRRRGTGNRFRVWCGVRVFLAALASCGLGGCAGTWDEVTSRDFSFKAYFHKPDPLVVLRDSTDNDKRAEALRALREPRQYGGTQEQQEVVVQVLTTAATGDRSWVCRNAAVQSLRAFKDPRAVAALKEAYYRAGSLNPEAAANIRCQALAALGDTGNPDAVETLVRVLRAPPAEGAEVDRQQQLDERIAAARALSNFKHYDATEALVEVLRGEQDVALRDRAHESLKLATGKNLPPDAQAWADFLHPSGDRPAPEGGNNVFNFILTGWK
jgi:hypothetical protein